MHMTLEFLTSLQSRNSETSFEGLVLLGVGLVIKSPSLCYVSKTCKVGELER